MNRLLPNLLALLAPFVAGAVIALFLFRPETLPVPNETVVKVYRKQIARTEKNWPQPRNRVNGSNGWRKSG